MAGLVFHICIYIYIYIYIYNFFYIYTVIKEKTNNIFNVKIFTTATAFNNSQSFFVQIYFIFHAS